MERADVDIDRSLGTPRAIRFARDRILADWSKGPEAAVRRFFEDHATIFSYRPSLDEMRPLPIRTAANTVVHVQLQQYYAGLRVVGGSYNCRWERMGNHDSF